jgi:hypothetical protein
VDCLFPSDESGAKCSRCGYTLKVAGVVYRQCPGPPGWGDRLAWLLKVTRLARLAPSNCRCPQRQAKLNALGRWCEALWRWCRSLWRRLH